MSGAVLLCSGGLDSTVLAYKLIRDAVHVTPVFIDYGQHCANTELATARRVLPATIRDKVEVLDLSSVYRHSSSRLIRAANLWMDPVSDDDLYVPLRNLLLFSAAAAFAQSLACEQVYAAIINTVRAKEVDCSVEFFGRLRDVMDVYGTVELVLPFRLMSKVDVAQLGVSLGAPIGETFSCQAAPEVACGACPNCVERLAAFDSILGEPK